MINNKITFNNSSVTKQLAAKRPAREITWKQLEVERSVTEILEIIFIRNTITNTLEGQAWRVALSERNDFIILNAGTANKKTRRSMAITGM